MFLHDGLYRKEEWLMLIGLELVREVIESVIMTGRLQGHDPVSILLIASPESGKTSVVLEKECAGILALTDVTGRGLQELCKMRPEITHLVINDLVAVTAHKSSVSKYTIAMLNAMTEEGIMATAFPGNLEKFANGRRGIIASVPTTMARDKRNWWNKVGLSSRMIPFAFRHSDDLNIRIKALITSDREREEHKKNKVFPIPNGHIKVNIPSNYARTIQALAENVSQRMDEEGYRRLKQFRALACGHALLRAWRTPSVVEKDVEFLEKITPYISYTKPREIG